MFDCFSVLVLTTISILCFSVGRCQQCVFHSCLVSAVFGVDHHQLVFWCWPVSAACVSVLPGVSGVLVLTTISGLCFSVGGFHSVRFSLAWCQQCLVLTTISLCFSVVWCQQCVYQSCLVSTVLTTISLCFSVGRCRVSTVCVSVLPGVSSVDHHQRPVFQC